jgi:hypothetical protein
MATVITIVNYKCTVIMIINYDPKTFIVQTTGMLQRYFQILDKDDT